MKELDYSKIPDYGIRKKELAERLGLSPRTISTYHQIALEYCGDFATDYPQIDGKPITLCPITPYQCWVIENICFWIHSRKIPIALLENKLGTDYKFESMFSKKAFLNTNQVKVEVQNHDITGICRVA